MGKGFFFVTLRIITMLCFLQDSYGQQSDCKVLIPALSGSYSGKCKDGLANRKGIAIGTDKYEGQFYKGLPQGKGTYTWSNGSWYTGQWVEGKRDGIGKMVYHLSGKDSTVLGYWKQDRYVDANPTPPYTVTRNLGVIHYNFRKLDNTNNNVIFKFFIGGRINSDIEGLSIATDSGDQYNSGYSTGIQNYSAPLDVKITYRTWNQLHSSQSGVSFEFILNEPGSWEITINN